MENITLLANALEYAGLKVKVENDHTLVAYHPYRDDISKGLRWNRMVCNASRIFNPKAVVPVCEFKATIVTL